MSEELAKITYDGEDSDIDSENADEVSGSLIQQTVQDNLSGGRLSDLQKRIFELQKFVDSINFGDESDWKNASKCINDEKEYKKKRKFMRK